MVFSFAPIGTIRSCFTEKFGIPRQPGLAPAAQGQLILLPPFNTPEALVGLEGVSHLWVQFVFHQGYSGWKARVKMPRLGGNKTLGVFATRSPNRPNNIGLSVVQLLSITREPQLILNLGGIDFLDGTPVLDIKPYLPYADVIPNARNDWASLEPVHNTVVFSALALQQLVVLSPGYSCLQDLICQVLAQDPRPSYQRLDHERHYGMRLWDLDVHWRVLLSGEIEVVHLERVS